MRFEPKIIMLFSFCTSNPNPLDFVKPFFFEVPREYKSRNKNRYKKSGGIHLRIHTVFCCYMMTNVQGAGFS